MVGLCTTIEECWDRDPEARLSSHCVLYRLRDFEHIINGTTEVRNKPPPSDFHSSFEESSFSNDTVVTDLSEDIEHSSSSSVKMPLIVNLPD